jgi:hypothetical protein
LIFQEEGNYSEARKKLEEARDTFALREDLQPQVQMCLDTLAELDEVEESSTNNP